jgi:hypothetical protein
MTNGPTGRLVGSGTGMVFAGDSVVAGDYRVSGRIYRSSGVTRAVFSVKVKGEDLVAGVLTSFSISANYDLVVSPAGMNGSVSGKAKFDQLGKADIRSYASVPLPGGVDGRWFLQMDVLPVVKLGGSGHLFLSNGRPLETKLTGTYSPASDHSQVRLTGVDSSKGTSLLLSFTTEDSADDVGISGTILGQKVQQ